MNNALNTIKILVVFEGEPKTFLSLKWQKIADDKSLTIHLSQETNSSTLIEELGLGYLNSVHTPCRYGCPVDNITSAYHPPPSKLKLSQEQLQSVVGSLNWIAYCIRIDISTITNMLAQHLNSATPSHVAAVCYVVNYIKGCKSLGIKFTM